MIETNEAFERIVNNASFGISTNDHELMSPDNYNKYLMQHIADVGLVRQAIEAYAASPEITRGSGDIFKEMGLEQAPFPTLKGKNNG